MGLEAEEILDIWERARRGAVGDHRREDFLSHPRIGDLGRYTPAELEQAFGLTSLLDEAAQWLRNRDQLAKHGRAPVQPAMSAHEKAAKATAMRSSPTDAEEQLWARLRNGVAGHQVVMQWPVDGWIADVAVPDADLVIEVDGSAHKDRGTADALRDDHMRANHLEVLRFSNADIDHDLDAVVQRIEAAVRARLAKTEVRRAAEADMQLADDIAKLEAAKLALADERRREKLARHSRQPAKQQSTPKIRFRCDTCDREFVAPLLPQPTCRADEKHQLQRQCRERSCTAWIPLVTERCRRCADARDIARGAAGRGARSPSQLKQARRGKRWDGK